MAGRRTERLSLLLAPSAPDTLSAWGSGTFKPRKPVGVYNYRVQACNPACGEPSGFHVVKVAPGKPVIAVSPNPSLTGDYTVSWSPVIGATSYTVEEQAAGGTPVNVSTGSPSLSWPATDKPNGSYVYRVSACANGVCGNWSDPKTETVQRSPAPLPPPANFRVDRTPVAVGASYVLSWDGVSGATNYRLDELTSGSWPAIQNTSALSRTVSGKPIGSYSYRVRACRSAAEADCGGVSGTVTVSVQAAPPQTPDPPATITTSKEISYDGNYIIRWDASARATYYLLEQRINGGAPTETNEGSALFHSWSLRPSGSYAYRVRACNAAGCSAYTGSVTTAVYRTPPTPTLSVSPSLSTDGRFTLTWNAVTDGARYGVLQRINGGGMWQGVSLAGASGQTLPLERTVNGRYTYKISACNNAPTPICSDYSAEVEVEVRIPGAPSAPAFLNISVVGPTLPGQCKAYPAIYTASWGSSEGADHYELREQEAQASSDVTHVVRGAVYKDFTKTYFIYATEYFSYTVRACAPARRTDSARRGWGRNGNALGPPTLALRARRRRTCTRTGCAARWRRRTAAAR